MAQNSQKQIYLHDLIKQDAPFKLNKGEVFYKSPANLPNIIYRYRCDTCVFYKKGTEMDINDVNIGDCMVVDNKGTPDKDTIMGNAWCLLWLATPTDIPFGWLFGK